MPPKRRPALAALNQRRRLLHRVATSGPAGRHGDERARIVVISTEAAYNVMARAIACRE